MNRTGLHEWGGVRVGDMEVCAKDLRRRWKG